MTLRLCPETPDRDANFLFLSDKNRRLALSAHVGMHPVPCSVLSGEPGCIDVCLSSGLGVMKYVRKDILAVPSVS